MSKIFIRKSIAFPGKFCVYEGSRLHNVHFFLWTAKRKAKNLSKNESPKVDESWKIVYENGKEVK